MTDLECYLLQMDASPEEKRQVESWVQEGNDIQGNPWLLHFENGATMDYLSAYRFVHEQEAEVSRAAN